MGACHSLLVSSSIRIVAIFTTGSVSVLNILAIACVLHVMMRPHNQSKKILLYLVLTGLFMGVYIMVILAHDYKFGQTFPLHRSVWLTGRSCQVCHFISSLCITGSAMSVCILVIEWVLAVGLTFKAESLIKSCQGIFQCCLIIPLGLAGVRAFSTSIDNQLCFPYSYAMQDPTTAITHLSLAVFDAGLHLATIFLLGWTVNLIDRSRRGAGRNWSQKDTRMCLRMCFIGGSTGIQLVALGWLVVSALLDWQGDCITFQCIVLIVLSMNAAGNPLLFVLSTNLFPRMMFGRAKKANIESDTSMKKI